MVEPRFTDSISVASTIYMFRDKKLKRYNIHLKRNERRREQRFKRYGERPHGDKTCPYCNGEMSWCSCCEMYSSNCCQDYGTCQCS